MNGISRETSWGKIRVIYWLGPNLGQQSFDRFEGHFLEQLKPIQTAGPERWPEELDVIEIGWSCIDSMHLGATVVNSNFRRRSWQRSQEIAHAQTFYGVRDFMSDSVEYALVLEKLAEEMPEVWLRWQKENSRKRKYFGTQLVRINLPLR